MCLFWVLQHTATDCLPLDENILWVNSSSSFHFLPPYGADQVWVFKTLHSFFLFAWWFSGLGKARLSGNSNGIWSMVCFYLRVGLCRAESEEAALWIAWLQAGLWEFLNTMLKAVQFLWWKPWNFLIPYSGNVLDEG